MIQITYSKKTGLYWVRVVSGGNILAVSTDKRETPDECVKDLRRIARQLGASGEISYTESNPLPSGGGSHTQTKQVTV